MSRTTYAIIPDPRPEAWTPALEDNAQALIAGARTRGEFAALALLFRDPELTLFRPEIYSDFVAGGAVLARVRWVDIYFNVGIFGEALSEQARAALMLACSMVSVECKVRLGDQLGKLGPQMQTAFAEAVAYLAGGA